MECYLLQRKNEGRAWEGRKKDRRKRRSGRKKRRKRRKKRKEILDDHSFDSC